VTGNDIRHALSTLLEAKLYCESNDKCAGFSFEAPQGNDNVDNTKVRIFFKGISVGKPKGGGEGKWQTYLKSDGALEEMRGKELDKWRHVPSAFLPQGE
jgi:hypothetical protein